MAQLGTIDSRKTPARLQGRCGDYVYIWELENWPDSTWDSGRLAALLGRMQSLGFDLRREAQLMTLNELVAVPSLTERATVNSTLRIGAPWWCSKLRPIWRSGFTTAPTAAAFSDACATPSAISLSVSVTKSLRFIRARLPILLAATLHACAFACLRLYPFPAFRMSVRTEAQDMAN